MRTYSPLSALRGTWANRPVLAGLLLAATLGSAACGGGSNSSEGPTPPEGPGPEDTCFEQPGQELGGSWQVTGAVIELDTDVSATYVPNGLDDLELDLDFLLGAQDQGICTLLYAASSGALDTTSPTGGPSTMLAFSASILPAGVFGLLGMLYDPANDVTTSFDVEFGSIQPLSPTSFQCIVDFEVFDGEQIELVIDDVPGEDDDGDGEIDEPDELDPSEGIDPNAVLVCAGRMRLTISRTTSAASSHAPALTTTRRGILRDAADTAAHPALVTVDAERMLVRLETDGLLLGAIGSG